MVLTLPSASPPFTSHLMHNGPSFPLASVCRLPQISAASPTAFAHYSSSDFQLRSIKVCTHNATIMDTSHHSNLSSWEMLQELDPSPIDSPDPELAEEDRKDLLPEVVKDTAGAGIRPGSGIRSPPSHVLGLSGLGGGHGAVYYCM